MVLTTLTEETFLLHHDAQNDVRSFASHNESPTDLRQRAKTALMSLFAVYWVVVFARSIGTTSKVGLVHSLACAEHYGLQPSSSSVLVDCRLADVDARTSSVLAYIVSVSNLASCFFALVLSPPLIKRLGYRGYVTLGTVLLTLHLYFPVLVAGHTREIPRPWFLPNWQITPKAGLRMMVAESLISGALGCPDMLFEIASRAIVIDSVPPSSRSTWLARLSANKLIGSVGAALLLQTLPLDTHSDLLIDALPLKLGAAISISSILACFKIPSLAEKVFTSPTLPDAATDEAVADALTSAPENTGSLSKLRRGFINALHPLRLLARPIQNPATRKSDWSLSRVITAYMLTNQIGIATNTLLVYCPSRFELHAKELSLMLGWLNGFGTFWLALAFPLLAKRSRQYFEPTRPLRLDEDDGPVNEQVVTGGPAAAERVLSVGALLLDAAGWLVLAAAGAAGNFPLFCLGLAFYSMSCPSESTIASLASMLVPEGTETEDLSAALSFLNSVMCTICPVMTSWIYGAGLHAHIPELVFIFTAAISTVAGVLVSSTRIPRSTLTSTN